MTTATFEVISWLPRPNGTDRNVPPFQPHSIKRTVDGEIFTIGDRVTNGTQMQGQITGFGFLNDRVYIEHTWSGVGMGLESLIKVPVLPSRFQYGDRVTISFERMNVPLAHVVKVHFSNNRIQYDLEINLRSNISTRIYNVDEKILEAYEERK